MTMTKGVSRREFVGNFQGVSLFQRKDELGRQEDIILTWAEANSLVDYFFNILRITLMVKGSVKLPGIGTIRLEEHKGRPYQVHYDLANGKRLDEPITCRSQDRRVPTLKATDAFLKEINKPTKRRRRK